MRSLFSRLASITACLLLLAGAAACGDGEEEEALSTTATPSPRAVVPLPTVDPDVPLVEYQSPDGGFTVGYPQGWEVVERATGGDIGTFAWSVDGRPVAQLTVLCSKEEDRTLDDLIERDTAIVANLGGKRASDPVPIDIAGIEGKQTTYKHGVAGLTIEQAAAYAVTEDCGWRIGLAAYGGGSLESFLPLFDRIVASFRLD
jgi:hypothetical protein